MVEGSLDRAVDVAATLELRGHSLGGRAGVRRDPAPPSPRLLIAAVGIAAVALAPALGGGEFAAYPAVSMDTGAATLASCALLPLLALLPFARIPSRRAAPARLGDARA
jgi:hypothetical protein